MNKISVYLEEFDNKYKELKSIDNIFYENIWVKSFVSKAKTRDSKWNYSEEYIRARFVYAMIYSWMYDKEYICVEFWFPKWNWWKSLNPDIVIFKNKDWLFLYKEAKSSKDFSKIRKNVLVIFETKKNNKSVSLAIENQLRSAMELNTSKDRIFWIYFDNEPDILIFKKIWNSEIKRFNEKLAWNFEDLNLAKRDFILDLPSQKDLIENNESISNLSKLKLTSLDSIDEENFKSVLETLKRANDKIKPKTDPHTLIVEFLTLKVFDEKRSLKDKNYFLKFYYNPEEDIKIFRERIKELYKEAKQEYWKVLSKPYFSYDSMWRPSDIWDEKFLIALVCEFQKRAILKTKNESFNQIIFNNFANDKQKAEKWQFFTPVPVVNHIISLLNPCKWETFCDPCCWIADFLAMWFRHMHKKEMQNNAFFETADNFYGFDIDKSSLKLAELNLVLNWDWWATLKDMDSLWQKFLENGSITSLEDKENKKPAEFSTKNFFITNWENKNDISKNPKKFKIIATNPPFWKWRDLKTWAKWKWDLPKDTVEMYETFFEKTKKEDWKLWKAPNSMDMWALFLENLYKLLEDWWRMAIVLSNSIASIKEWQNIRKWFIQRMRIVATFDLPSNTFWETWVATTVIVAYKPKLNEKYLLENDYEVYVKEIENTWYEVKTKDRIVHFQPQFIIDEETFEKTDKILEDFTNMQQEFKEFLKYQEQEIKTAFHLDLM